jgi:tetratricopeptide (TPR) repeat protein
MRRLVVAGFVLVVAGLALYGQSAALQQFKVQYLDGSVQVQLKGQTAWKTLKVNEKVPTDATIRLAKGAMIELASGKTVLTLIKDGVYPMTSLLAKVQATSGSLGSTVALKLKAVSSDPVQSSTTGGVRAADATAKRDWSNGGYTLQQMLDDEKYKADQISKNKFPDGGFEIDNLQFTLWGVRGGYADRMTSDWAEEYGDAVDLGVRALIKSDYESAINHLRDAVTQAILPNEVRKANYLLAVAYAEAGSPARAWKIISEMSITTDDPEYGDFLIRKAQLQVDALQYEDALTTLKPLLEPLQKDDFGQAACLVAWFAYKGLNRTREAADIRQKGLSIVFYGEDDKGNKVVVQSEAARLLAGLE